MFNAQLVQRWLNKRQILMESPAYGVSLWPIQDFKTSLEGLPSGQSEAVAVYSQWDCNVFWNPISYKDPSYFSLIKHSHHNKKILNTFFNKTLNMFSLPCGGLAFIFVHVIFQIANFLRLPYWASGIPSSALLIFIKTKKRLYQENSLCYWSYFQCIFSTCSLLSFLCQSY